MSKKGLIRNQYNYWTVIGYDGLKGKNTYLICRCKCGIIRNVRKQSVLNGTSRSCGCYRKDREKAKYKDFIGRKFCKLTVLFLSEKKSTKGKLWKCKCECGKESFASGSDLLRGHRKSCGYCRNRGITSKANLKRQSSDYKVWRKTILTRENYTCQKCKERGGKLQVHHISNFASIYNECDEILYDLSNGITLCKDCHILFHHMYGYTDNNIEQINEFLNG